MTKADVFLRTGIMSLVLVIVLVLSSGSTRAGEIRQFRDWQLVQTGSECRLVSLVTSQATGSLLMEVSILPGPDAAMPYLIAIRVPIGASLASGIALRHAGRDRTAIGLEWLSCDQEMCAAGGQLSTQAIGNLRRDRSVFVGFSPMLEARPVNIELSLMGFTAASDALNSCRKT